MARRELSTFLAIRPGDHLDRRGNWFFWLPPAPRVL